VKAELWPVSKVERDAKMEGRRMTLVLQPDHKPAGAKPPVQGGRAPATAPAPVGGLRGGPANPAGSGLNIPNRPAAAPASAAPTPPQPAPATR
jgi:hypothetical protein